MQLKALIIICHFTERPPLPTAEEKNSLRANKRNMCLYTFTYYIFLNVLRCRTKLPRFKCKSFPSIFLNPPSPITTPIPTHRLISCRNVCVHGNRWNWMYLQWQIGRSCLDLVMGEKLPLNCYHWVTLQTVLKLALLVWSSHSRFKDKMFFPCFFAFPLFS